MKIDLQIEVATETLIHGTVPRACSDDCPFLDDDWIAHVGTCLLFKEPCPPQMQFGDIMGWTPCKSCIKVAQKEIDKNA